MARARLRSWHLEPIAPHQPLRPALPVAARGARLTRLVHPIDMMPFTSAATRPSVQAN
jgi:hypothetical protein